MQSKRSVSNLTRKLKSFGTRFERTGEKDGHKAGGLHNCGLVYAWSRVGFTVQKIVTYSQTTTSKLRLGVKSFKQLVLKTKMFISYRGKAFGR